VSLAFPKLIMIIVVVVVVVSHNSSHRSWQVDMGSRSTSTRHPSLIPRSVPNLKNRNIKKMGIHCDLI